MPILYFTFCRMPGVTFSSNPGQISLARMVWNSTLYGMPTSGDPYFEGCNITFNNLVNAAGEVVFIIIIIIIIIIITIIIIIIINFDCPSHEYF